MKAVLGTIGPRLLQYTVSSVNHAQKVTEDQCSPVQLKRARLDSSLLYHIQTRIVRFLKPKVHCLWPETIHMAIKLQPRRHLLIGMLRFTLRLPCHMMIMTMTLTMTNYDKNNNNIFLNDGVSYFFCFQRLLNTRVQSPLYRWVKLCHRSLRIWIPIHIEFHWASAQESHRMLIIMLWLDLSSLNTKFSWLAKTLKSSYKWKGW